MKKVYCSNCQKPLNVGEDNTGDPENYYYCMNSECRKKRKEIIKSLKKKG